MMAQREALDPQGIPSITIERSPVNDLCVVLSLIAPTRQMAASLADPATFLERYSPELEMAARLIRARVDAAELGGVLSPPISPPASHEPEPKDEEAARDGATRARSQDLGSLLR